MCLEDLWPVYVQTSARSLPIEIIVDFAFVNEYEEYVYRRILTQLRHKVKIII